MDNLKQVLQAYIDGGVAQTVSDLEQERYPFYRVIRLMIDGANPMSFDTCLDVTDAAAVNPCMVRSFTCLENTFNRISRATSPLFKDLLADVQRVWDSLFD